MELPLTLGSSGGCKADTANEAKLDLVKIGSQWYKCRLSLEVTNSIKRGQRKPSHDHRRRHHQVLAKHALHKVPFGLCKSLVLGTCVESTSCSGSGDLSVMTPEWQVAGASVLL